MCLYNIESIFCSCWINYLWDIWFLCFAIQLLKYHELETLFIQGITFPLDHEKVYFVFGQPKMRRTKALKKGWDEGASSGCTVLILLAVVTSNFGVVIVHCVEKKDDPAPMRRAVMRPCGFSISHLWSLSLLPVLHWTMYWPLANKYTSSRHPALKISWGPPTANFLAWLVPPKARKSRQIGPAIKSA